MWLAALLVTAYYLLGSDNNDCCKKTKKKKSYHPFYKKNVVITGSFSDVSIRSRLSGIGAIVKISMSSSVDYLIVGDNPSQSKIQAANKFGIKIIYEEELCGYYL